MQKFTTLIIAALLGSAILWADDENTQNTQNTKKSQNTQESTDTFQPYVKKNKKSQNVSGILVGADLGIGFSGNTLKPGPYTIIDESGTSIGAFWDLKVGYKHYFFEQFALRGYASLGYGARLAAVNSGITTDYTTTALRLGIGADAIYDITKSFGVFAGFAIENHSWTHTIESLGARISESEGSNVLPRLQIGIMMSGFEAGLVYYTSAIQPANGLVNYQNDIALKVGYTYTFAL